MPNTKSSILYSGVSRFKEEDGQYNHTLWKGTDRSTWPAAERWTRHRRGQENAWREDENHGHSDIPMIGAERMHDFDKKSVAGSDCKEKSVTDDTVEDIKRIQERFEPGSNSVKGLLVLVTQKTPDFASTPTTLFEKVFGGKKPPPKTLIGCGTLVSPEILNTGTLEESEAASQALTKLKKEYMNSGSTVSGAINMDIGKLKYPSMHVAESLLEKEDFAGLGVTSIDRTSADAFEAFEYSM